MRIIKLILFALVVSAVFVGAYWLIVRPSSDGDDAYDSGGLRRMCIERIHAYGDSISQYGWNDDYLTAAHVLISGHRNDLSQSEIQQLDNTLQSVFLAQVDSLICSCYGSGMTDGNIRSGSILDKAYNGLDKLASDYPSIRSSQRWASLSKLRKLHKEIYNFGQRSFSHPARSNLRLQWQGDVAVIRMGEVLDYSSYMRTMRSMRSDLETRCAEIEELRTSPWTSVALDKGRVESKLARERTAYIDRERRAVEAFASRIVPQIHDHFKGRTGFSSENAKALNARLGSIETELNRKGIMVSGFGKVKSQISRIYIDQI